MSNFSGARYSAVELELIAKRDTGPVSAIEHHVAEDLGLKEKK
jgi:hypothetical protein